MANPVAYEEKAADRSIVNIRVKFTLGASGAVASVQAGRECLASTGAVVKQSGAGTYRIMLKEKWNALRGLQGQCMQASFSAAAGQFAALSADNVGGTGPYVEFVLLRPDTGVAANGASGDIVYVTVELQKEKLSR